jgi:hypothetical protein
VVPLPSAFLLKLDLVGLPLDLVGLPLAAVVIDAADAYGLQGAHHLQPVLTACASESIGESVVGFE